VEAVTLPIVTQVRVMVSDSAHPEVRIVIASDHCLRRMRQRAFRGPGAEALVEAFRRAIDGSHFARVAPAWAAGQQAPMWAFDADLAFPLMPAGVEGEWVAATVLRRDRR
jgi:hypothetical protein